MYNNDCSEWPSPNRLLTIYKINTVTGAPLAGAIFELTDFWGRAIRNETDATGQLTFTLTPCANYTLQEVSAPAGFLSTQQIYRIQVNRRGEIAVDGCCRNQLIVGNAPIPAPPAPGTLIFRKQDALTRQPLAGTVFALLRNGSQISQAVSSENGLVNFGQLTTGAYQITEITPPAGYEANDAIYQVVASDTGAITINDVPADTFIVTNTATLPITASFTAIKVSSDDGAPLAGASFSLSQNTTEITSEVSNEAGEITFTDLSPGTYSLVETSAPEGYQINPESLAVVVSPTGSVTIENESADGYQLINVPIEAPVSAELSFQKQDAVTAQPLAGATFQLSQSGIPVTNATSTAEGLVDLGLRSPGAYQLTETAVPSGYEDNDTIYQVTISTAGVVTIDDNTPLADFVVANVPITASFSATKVNLDDEEPLAGAIYSLQQNEAEIDTATSGADGTVTFSNLSPGTYELVETTPPDGYQTNPTSLEVLVNSDGSVLIEGQPADGYLLIDIPLDNFLFLKEDSATNRPLPGATFELSQAGSPVTTRTSDASGQVDFGVLTPGAYQLTETDAPSGYDPNGTIYEVVIGADGAITVGGVPLAEFTVSNTATQIAVSDAPEINPVTTGDVVVTGTGIANSDISVRFPSGTIVTTTVDSDDTWSVDVPSGETLPVDDIVAASQTEAGKRPSDEATIIIISSAT